MAKTPVKAPVWPPKPDLSDEVEWGPLPTNDAYMQAHLCWRCPNESMMIAESDDESDDESQSEEAKDKRAERAKKKERKTMEILAKNVYKDLEPKLKLIVPHTEPINTQIPLEDDGWTFPNINNEFLASSKTVNKTELEGHNILQDTRYWTIPRIQKYLESQGQGALIPKKPYHTAQQRREILQEYVNSGSSDNVSVPGLFPRSNLVAWGTQRQNQFIIPPSHGKGRLYNAFELYTWAIHLSPYNPIYWISRAYLFYQHCHFDLALGDCYRAWYLIEMLVNASERNKQPGLYPRIWDAIARHIRYGAEDYSGAKEKMRKENGINYFVPHLRRTVHHIISLSLLALRAWEDFEEMDKHLPARLQQVEAYKAKFEQRAEEWKSYVAHAKKEREEKGEAGLQMWTHQERMGAIHPRPYPQAGPDIDRANEIFLKRLNDTGFAENRYPLVVEGDQGNGLRVCARRDIGEDELIFKEEPSARSHLRMHVEAEHLPSTCENCKFTITAEERVDLVSVWGGLNEVERSRHEIMCACVTALPPLSFCHIDPDINEAPATTSSSRRPGKRTADQMAGPSGAATGRISKAAKGNAGQRRGTTIPDSDLEGAAEDTSGNATVVSCLKKARQKYHRYVCGKDWRWLHDAMGKIPQDTKGTEAVNYERHGTFLSLLLREVFDMTLMKRDADPEKHYLAHEINPMIPLQSVSPEGPFPFGWSANIVIPFNILQGLGVNIFKDFEFDTWVIQTVLRKLQLNYVPWDEHRRGRDDPVNRPTNSHLKSAPRPGRGKTSGQESTEGTNLENLYLHTGFALFNHGCFEHANAIWFWDDHPLPSEIVEDHRVRNRILVKSKAEITEGSEVLLNYYPEDPEQMREEKLIPKQKRILGQRCNCPGCERRMAEDNDGGS